jgi:hypothetical protein
MTKRWFLGVAMAIGLAACNGETVALGDIATEVQKQYGYVVTYQSIAKVVISLVSGFDTTASAAATVADGVASSVVNSICGAVKTTRETIAAAPPGADALAAAPTPLSVTVNGVKIDGFLVK